jgi:DNA invertase Pin-like site-specific DNA recombinase
MSIDGRHGVTDHGGRPHTLLRLIGYARVQVGGSLQDINLQVAAIRRGSRGRRWWVTEILTEEAPGADLHRPVLASALARIGAGEADGLVVARLDRLASSLGHFGRLIRDARQSDWLLVALDVGVDLSDRTGRLNAQAFEKAAEIERQLIAMRTTEVLRAKRTAGVRLGRPRTCPDEVLEQVVGLHIYGAGFQQIADELNYQRILTPGGGTHWHSSHVSRLLKTQDAMRLIQDHGALTVEQLRE